MRLVASIEPEYLELIMRHMPDADIRNLPYYPDKDPDPKIRDFLLRPEDKTGNQQLFRLDPALEKALADQKASVRDGQMGGEATYQADVHDGQMGGEATYQAAVPAMVKYQMIKDFFGQKTQPGTLDDAYLRGVPGIPKPTTPGTVRPSDNNVDYMEIHTL